MTAKIFLLPCDERQGEMVGVADVEPIFDGDLRIANLVERLQSVIDASKNQGITLAAAIGAIEIVKHDLLGRVLAGNSGQ